MMCSFFFWQLHLQEVKERGKGMHHGIGPHFPFRKVPENAGQRSDVGGD
jgi:hypothetical protein